MRNSSFVVIYTISCFKFKYPKMMSNQTIKKNYTTKWCDIDLDIISDFENESDNELPLSSIANWCFPIFSNLQTIKMENHHNELVQIKNDFNINQDNISEANNIIKNEHTESHNMQKECKKYECQICGKNFLRRKLIVKHFQTSLCFPEYSTIFVKNNSDNYGSNSSIFRENTLVSYDKINDSKCKVYTTQVVNQNENLNDICSATNYKAFKGKNRPRCKTCSRFIKISSLNSNEMVESFKTCKRCLAKDIKNVSLSKNNRLRCKTCSYFIKTPSLNSYEVVDSFNTCKRCLAKDIKKTDSLSENFKCNFCTKSFDQLNSLNSHLKVHDDNNSFKCDICEKTVRKLKYLEEHKKSHVNYYNRIKQKSISKKLYDKNVFIIYMDDFYKCRICKKNLRNKFTLKRHYMDAHNITKLFECDICHLTFTLRFNVNRHKEKHFKSKLV